MHCKNFSAVIASDVIEENDGQQKRYMVRARCKQWTCQSCAEINRKIWRRRIFYHIDGVSKKKQWSFFTLTPHKNCMDDNYSEDTKNKLSLKNIRSGLHKFLARFRRKFGTQEYIRVYEKFENGGYHVHFLMSVHFDDLECWTDKEGNEHWYSIWVKDAATKSGMGWKTHAANLETTMESVMYITKYMTKGEAKLEFGIRRIQASQGFTKQSDLPQEENSDAQWRLHHALVDKDIEDAIKKNYEWYDLNLGVKITSDNVDNWIGYPFNQPD